MDYKRCAKCGRVLSVSEFTKNIRNKDGLHSYCKSCNAEGAKKFRETAGTEYIRRYAKAQMASGYFRYGKGAYLNMKRSSFKRNIKFELTEELLKEWWLSQKDECFYCECDLQEYLKIKNFIHDYTGRDPLINYIKEHVYNKDNYYNIESMTIDRLDSKGPYSTRNMVKSCWICNSLKSNTISPDDMKRIGKDNLRKIRRLMKNG